MLSSHKTVTVMTKVWRVNSKQPDPDAIAEAAQIIRNGGLVAFPTETVYGLGASALDETAVRKIFAAKERPAWDPLIVHISRPEMVYQLVADVPESFWQLAKRFLPGPLTIVLPKKPIVPDVVTAGLPTVAIRMPKHQVALGLIEGAGVPVAAPSANRFGRPSPTTAEHVLADLQGRIDGVLDAGPTPVGVESTVLDLTKEPPVILRPGGVSREALEEVLSVVSVRIVMTKEGAEKGLPSPGMMKRHYAPSVPVVLADGNPQGLFTTIDRLLSKGQEPHRIGVLSPSDWSLPDLPLVIFRWGNWGDWNELAQRLFEGLRWLEGQGVSVIVAPIPPSVGLGLAVRDRLLKAAADHPC